MEEYEISFFSDTHYAEMNLEKTGSFLFQLIRSNNACFVNMASNSLLLLKSEALFSVRDFAIA